MLKRAALALPRALGRDKGRSMQGSARHAPEATNRLDALLASRRRLLIGYFPAGDPRVPVELIDVYAECGVDVLEIGIKAREPFMDGEVVAASMERSTGRGALEDARPVLDRLRARGRDMAALVFAYYHEFPKLPAPASWRGIDGLLGLPGAETSPDTAIRAAARSRGVRTAEFMPYEFGPADVERCRRAEAYVMLQAAPGRTGAREHLDPASAARIRRLREAGVTAPIVLGFGISRPQHAAQAIEMGADGIVVGSRCVDKCLEGEDVLAAFLAGMRAGLDG